VSRAIEDQLRLKYTQIHTDDPHALGYAEILQHYCEAGYWPFVALWDHFQAHLQLLICGREPGPLRPSIPGSKEDRSAFGDILLYSHLWYEGENDEEDWEIDMSQK
jgi:hypothetical protein